ncbi:iron complex transport system ATP-binding protein [Proteiniborus ethanoligenes]|uniref:Iron complex transport system ATP-binding protein n=1 Tax=Proteiniborus ethanoligenes TaxID=415015 RepID=A0A1H3QL60_9FIRM|nr:ABC transporter ATP-binding protein [Proteiniborus ethanoligenes]SDZ13715.1 iron complex transport system ATP-binding protein [Proteiniborus ethanoligenes]
MEMRIENISVNYGEKRAIRNANFDINTGQIVTIIGPNGSGKSTLVKAMSRCIKPTEGNIYLEGINIKNINTKIIAQKMAILPQVKNVSSDISVEELVSYGRYPHLKFSKRLGKEDIEIVDWALEKTGLIHLRKRFVATLSGGERQRAWIAMSLAQKPKILLLDEPTTFLDISYQVEVLELVKELNQTLGLTVVMVLHDLNQAARYSDKILVIKNGELCEIGKPDKIIKEKLLKDIFKINADIYEDKINNCPYFIPRKKVT